MDRIFQGLNDVQVEAVKQIQGYVLTLAGAGSGKTKVLTHRIAYLVSVGVSPKNIMAVTFTNKAAAEMRERITNLLGEASAKGLWVGTFHGLCIRILAQHTDKVGLNSGFSILDDKDQGKVLKTVCDLTGVNIDDDIIKALSSVIGLSKAKLERPDDWRSSEDSFKKKHAEVFQAYQDKLLELNAVDFDDIINLTIQLLERDAQVRGIFQRKFEYVLVDEYQDINPAQYRLIKILSERHKNLFVVGDADQSIYMFRGAEIQNILNFQKDFPEAKLIMLEENYRSTGNILTAANKLIEKNSERLPKKLWTRNTSGSQIVVHICENEYEEAEWIIGAIKIIIDSENRTPGEFAILYRTNTQSRPIEEALMKARLPYQVIGGLAFYERKEIKDALAYLRAIDNGFDMMAFTRIINVPKRGIGATTVNKIQEFANDKGIRFSEALDKVDEIESIKKGNKQKVKDFTELMKRLSRYTSQEGVTVTQVLTYILSETGYRKELEDTGNEEAEGRLNNLDELTNVTVSFDKSSDDPTLTRFLTEVSLLSDVDTMDNQDSIKLMTLHSAKGLEFPVVFVAGMEEELFPHYKCLTGKELEEERRLCYVGITRAQQRLYMTAAKERRKFYGVAEKRKISRFLRELPKDVIRVI